MPTPAKASLPAADSDGMGPHNPAMEQRVARLEDDMQGVKDLLNNQVMPYLARIDTNLASINAILPYLATKEDVANLRTELKTEIAEVKSELKNEIAEAKSELKNEIAEAKSELRNEIAEAKSELRNEIAEAKSELRNEIAEVRVELKSEIAEVRVDLGNRISKVEGMVSRIPTTLQLGAFVITIFVVSGLVRWGFGP